MAFTIRGVAAEIRWGYHTAATLGPWTVDDHALVATVTHVDAFRLSQSPLTLVVGQAVRPLTSVQITGRTLTASLGH